MTKLERDNAIGISEHRIKRILHPELLSSEELARIETYGNTERWKREELPRAQREVLEKYCQKKIVEDKVSINSAATYVGRLAKFAVFVKKPFDKMTKDDVIKFFSHIKDFRPRTINSYTIIVRNFFQWFYKMDGSNYPKIVKGLKQFKNNRFKLPEELLTAEEIKEMVGSADNPRDKALIFVDYESACRAAELLGIRIKHVSFDEYGAVVMVDGKTGQRRIRLINSVPALKVLLNNHPFKDDPEAPLWIDLSGKGYGKALFRSGLYHVLKKTAKRAGIKKNVYPHILRHSRLTELAKDLTEQELKIFAGWKQNSDMASVYVHLSGEDVEKKLLKKAGLLKEGKKQEDLLKPNACIRCKEKNSIGAKFCSKCYYPLELDAVNQIETLKSVINDFITTKLLQRPGFMEELPKLTEEWSKNKS